MDDKINDLFDGLPDDSRLRMAAVIELQQKFRSRAAEELQPSIERVLANPPTAFSDKQLLASELNHVFHELSIAPCMPGSNDPCTVIATRSSPESETGYLRLRARRGRKISSGPTNTLSEIGLVEAPREESFSRTIK